MSTLTEPEALYAGLISGTSMDGIDAALVRLGDRQCEMIATHAHPYPAELRTSLLNISRNPSSVCIDDIGRLDQAAALLVRARERSFGMAKELRLDQLTR